MTPKLWVIPALAGALLLAGVTTASANGGPLERTAFDAWISEASAVVSEAMVAPRQLGSSTIRSGHVLVTAHVLRDGRVAEAMITKRAVGARSNLDRAARKCIERLEALPSLEHVIEGETALVRIYLVYATSDDEMKLELKRAQNASAQVRRIARAEMPGDPLAKAPVINLIASAK